MKPSYAFKCKTADGEATVHASSPEWAADAFAHAMALDGEMKEGTDEIVTVTAPDGTTSRWLCHCTMEPHIDTRPIP